MASRTAADVLADVTGAMVRQDDVHDVLNRLLRDCLELLGAEAVGVMVLPVDGRLELLGATSHRAAELELFQIQTESGPCTDAIRRDEAICVVSKEEIMRLWPEVGAAVVGAGYASVNAFPVRWQGRVLGGLNVFRRSVETTDEQQTLGQTVADVISLILVHTVALTSDEVARSLRRVIAGRAVIERAKGVLAHQQGIDMGAAYEAVLEVSRERGVSLTAAAQSVVRSAHARS